MPNEFSPTPEQQSIISAVATRGPSAPSVMIEAAAGCAKTSTLKMAAPGIREPALALAFNKRIAEDLEKALPSHFNCKTMNGLGHGAWARAIEPRLQLDTKKIGRLVSEISKEFKLGLNTDQWDGLRVLVLTAMSNGLVPTSDPCAEASLAPDSAEGWQDIADSFGMFREDYELMWEAARRVLERSNELSRQGIVTFDDQIYCSVMLGGKFPRFPVVFVDEDQDLSGMQIRMLERVAAGRVVACGDHRQAIYHWRGALGDSAAQIRRVIWGQWADRTLLTTFRCPRAIVRRQLQHVPGFTAAPAAPEGEFALLPHIDPGWADPGHQPTLHWTIEDLMVKRPSASATIAVLCRNNAPLLRLAFKLIRRGIGVQMLGRDIGKGLTAIVKKLSGASPEQVPTDTLLGKLADWEQSEVSRASAEGKPEKLAGLRDKAECIRAVASGTEARDSAGVLRQIDLLFARQSGQLTLSSIHRAKGLEWDLVVHLDPWRVPSAQAKRAAREGNDVPLEQERNLLYVAETRTKHTLINANLEDFR